jgi:hypothetical protein
MTHDVMITAGRCKTDVLDEERREEVKARSSREMTSHSSRVRELKKSKSGGRMVNSEDENRAPIISKTESEKNNEKLVDEDLTKYTVNELRDKLKVATSP